MVKNNCAVKLGLGILGGAALGAGTLAFLTAPGRADRAARAPFMGRCFAHRGLHTFDRSVPENSLPAFLAAVEQGYGVELDVQLSADGEVMVFHDDTLRRLCGADGKIWERTQAQLGELRLAGTDERIPRLRDVLAAVDRRVPVIVELKHGPRRRELCEKTLALIDEAGGDICVESFDPLTVAWFRFHAPDILRGQLSCAVEKFGPDTSRAHAFALSRLLTNFLARPQFLAWGLSRKTLGARLCERMGAMRVAWTCQNRMAEDKNDAVIFEFHRPPVRFK